MSRQTAKVFTSGNSQAVRLPASFRFATNEVFIEREGDKVILSPKPSDWDAFFADAARPTDDFMIDRVDEPPQQRRSL